MPRPGASANSRDRVGANLQAWLAGRRQGPDTPRLDRQGDTDRHFATNERKTEMARWIGLWAVGVMASFVLAAPSFAEESNRLFRGLRYENDGVLEPMSQEQGRRF